MYILRTSIETFPELENSIKSLVKLETKTELILEFKRNENFFVLKDLEDLKEEMRIRVSIASPIQDLSKEGSSIELFKPKNWNRIVFLTQESNSKFRVEIDPDETPPQIKAQLAQLMEKASKLETCLQSLMTHSKFVFQLDFLTKNRAEKVFEQIVELFEAIEPKRKKKKLVNDDVL